MARSSAVSTLVKSMLAGGALASAYMAYKNYKDIKDEKKSHKGDIEVPLSRREFLSVVRNGASAKEEPKAEKVEKVEQSKPSTPVEKMDVGRMTPAELAAIKRKLLRKAAEVRNRPGLPTKVKTLDSNGVVYSHPTSTMARVSRDASGRFAPSLASDFGATTLQGISKKAQVFDTAGNIIAASIGVPAGILLAQRLVGKMIVNRRKADLVESKRKYVEELSKEVNDSRKGEFKYASHASQKLRKSAGAIKDVLVGAGGFGIALPALVAGISGILTYRVMENRRIKNEKESDKDLTNFPEEKHVKYKFAEERPYSPFNWVDDDIVNPAARLAHRLGRKVDDVKVKALDLLPGGMSGKLMTNAYLKGDGNGNRYLMNKILSRKETASDLYDYLAKTQEGQESLQEFVGKKLGNKWYTGPAKRLANTQIGRQMVMGQILEKTLPKVNGSTDLAMACLAAGGKV